MKNKLFILLCIGLLFGAGMFGIYKYQIKENVIYSQSILDTKTAEQKASDTYITRVEAIQEAYQVFEEGIGISVKSSDLVMYINLYKESDNYVWIMSWYGESTAESYSCTIAADTGEIRNLYVVEPENHSETNKSHGLSQEEVIALVKPLLKVMEIDWNDYNIEMQGTLNKDDACLQYSRCRFVNKENSKDTFSIELDGKRKCIVSYEKK